MKAAASQSKKNLKTNDGGPFGAVLVKNGKIISRGHNQVLLKHDPTCHAEMQAIRKASAKLGTHDLSDCTLYTSCYPCPMCLSAAIWANIKQVVYGNTAEDAAAIGFRDDYIYHYIQGGCTDRQILDLTQADREITIPVFQKFSQKTDKTIY